MISYNGKTLSQEYLDHIVKLAGEYNILPSFLICQSYFESGWGSSNVARLDKNWAGINWSSTYTGKSGIPKSKGSNRPASEGGNYVHYDNHYDGISDWVHLLRDGHFYKVTGVDDFNLAVKGLFKVGGAQYDYAASGYQQYLKGMADVRQAMNRVNNNILDKLDQEFIGGEKSMASIEAMIKWMTDRVGKVTYSMKYRLGPYSYDCSSAVYHALWAGGFKTRIGYAGNTETLFREKGYLFEEITVNQARRGDIFVAGRQGSSLGGAGHTGIHLGDGKIIHCTYPKNGIAITPVSGWTGGPPVRWFRIKGATGSVPTYKEPTVPFTPLEVGSMATIREGATRWQTGERGIDNYVGESYKILQVKEVRQSYSKRAYLLDDLVSWALEQDLVEARKPAPKSSLSEAANQVINGDHGNGPDRVNNLKAAGYTDAEIEEIQAIVNKAVGHTETLEVAKAQQDELSENEFMDKDGVVWIWRKKK